MNIYLFLKVINSLRKLMRFLSSHQNRAGLSSCLNFRLAFIVYFRVVLVIVQQNTNNDIFITIFTITIYYFYQITVCIIPTKIYN